VKAPATTINDNTYLSIVAASRNDHHGGDILKRMTLFMNGLIAQANRHRLPAELIMVEWNPPENRPLLHTVLPNPGPGDYLKVRYIIVPNEIHRRYKRADEIPLFQMIAKNVGLRRAKGEYILCTNIDILFSDPLFRILATRNLRRDTFYRANRCDVPDCIDPTWGLDTQLAWCGQNTIRRLGMDARFKNINLEQLGLNHRAAQRWFINKLARGLRMFWPPEKIKYFQIDSYACGDFTLMSREAWLDIEGYLELDLYSIHIDTLGLIAATSLGFRQHIFSRDACIYHIDHPVGWLAMNPVDKIRFLESRPGIDYGLVLETGLFALREKARLPINSPNWGFADQVFEEYVFP
jgi:hypothetical protein